MWCVVDVTLIKSQMYVGMNPKGVSTPLKHITRIVIGPAVCEIPDLGYLPRGAHAMAGRALGFEANHAPTVLPMSGRDPGWSQNTHPIPIDTPNTP